MWFNILLSNDTGKLERMKATENGNYIILPLDVSLSPQWNLIHFEV